MRFYKTITRTLGAVAAILCLCSSCSSKPPQTSEEPAQDGTSLSFIDFMREGDGTGAENGYYRIIPRSDGSNNIAFIDYETRSQVFLCNRPECLHEDETCTSWLPYGGGGGALLPAGNHLFYLSFGNTTPSIAQELGEDALPQIIEMDLNGGNHTVRQKLNAFEQVREGVAYDDSAIYFICDSYENGINGDLQTRSLYRYDIQSKTLENLKELSPSEQIVGVNGRSLIFNISDGAQDITENVGGIETKIVSYDVDTQEESVLLSHPFTTMGRVYNGYYYMYNPSDSILLRQQLKPDAPLETIRKGVFDNEHVEHSGDVKTIFDNHWYMTFEIPQNAEKTMYSIETYAVDLDSGKPTPIELKVKFLDRKGVGKQVEIVDELEDYFLVIESVADREVTIPIAEPPIPLPYLYFQYSLIEKSDYYNSQPNYIPIEGISLEGNA